MNNKKPRLHFLVLISMTTVAFSPASFAFNFNYDEIQGYFDSTVTYGQTYRTQSRASDLIGIANGGTAFSVNGDDGNLNYDSGLISNTFRFTSELDLRYRNFGGFLRFTGFKDTKNDDADNTKRTDLTEQAIELVGEDLRLLDAYVWGNFDIGRMPVDIRVGDQVLSWGESTFIPNGVNIINPVDVAQLRTPGAELRNALIPVGMASLNVGLIAGLSVEGFYQYDYDKIDIDPPGSYFSTNDFVGDGGSCAVLGFGSVTDYPLLAAGDGSTTTCQSSLPVPPFFAPISVFSASRSPDRRPDDGGQYGAALRWYSEALNNTEFGFFFINYHSRLPIISAISSTPAAPFSPPTNNPAAPATYFIEYPEDIKVYAVSFNTQLGTTGWALQGEYSFKDDVPLQVDDNELLTAALHFDLIPVPGTASQLGAFGNGVEVPGFIRRNVSQLQMTATRIFGPALGSDQTLLLAEFAISHVHGMPKQEDLRLEAPGTSLPGNPVLAAIGIAPGVETNDFADATSWGYRVLLRSDFNRAIGAVNLQPRISWRHDVNGNSPGPGGNFIEGNKSVSVGLRGIYLNEWEADLSYTSFFGAGTQNLLYDRDFVSFSLSYSF
jgi:hypothetical protein